MLCNTTIGNIMTFNSFHCEKKGGGGHRLKKVEEVIIKLDFPTNSKGSNSALHFRMIFLLIVREVTLLYISGSFHVQGLLWHPEGNTILLLSKDQMCVCYLTDNTAEKAAWNRV